MKDKDGNQLRCLGFTPITLQLSANANIYGVLVLAGILTNIACNTSFTLFGDFEAGKDKSGDGVLRV